MNFSFINLYGDNISPYLDQIAKLRIEVFREFPYIYDGNHDYEKSYLKRYIDSPNSLIAVALSGDNVIGATTCLPLKDEVDALKKPFVDANIALDKVFYFGESMIKKEFRGNKIGHEFFKLREEHARKLIPNLEWTSFCAVIRPEDHPLKPKAYKPLDGFWSRMGYIKDENMVAQFPWKDINQLEEDEKSLVFWKKKWN